VLADVQRAALENNRFYPVSLGAEGSCQIGGNIATNAGGTGVLRYGNTRDNVMGLAHTCGRNRGRGPIRDFTNERTGSGLRDGLP
jgi:FAD/FMN-containing dehydrogenase